MTDYTLRIDEINQYNVQAIISQFNEQLSPILKNKNPIDQKRYIVSRIILAKQLGLSLEKLFTPEFIYVQAHGKPFFSNTQLPYFNISHTKNEIAVAFSKQPIGVDIENVQRKISSSSWKKICSKQEYQRLCNADLNIRVQLWTIKEAVLKAIGTGLYIKPDLIQTNSAMTRATYKDQIFKIELIKLKNRIIGTVAIKIN